MLDTAHPLYRKKAATAAATTTPKAPDLKLAAPPVAIGGVTVVGVPVGYVVPLVVEYRELVYEGTKVVG